MMCGIRSVGAALVAALSAGYKNPPPPLYKRGARGDLPCLVLRSAKRRGSPSWLP